MVLQINLTMGSDKLYSIYPNYTLGSITKKLFQTITINKQLPLIQSTTSNYQLINDVISYKYSNIVHNSIYTRVLSDKESANYTENYTQIPQFFNQNYTVKIPSKVLNLLKMKLPKKYLKEIHDDPEVAVELCLLMLTRVNSTYLQSLNGEYTDGWIALKAEFLREYLSIGNLTYKKVREVLEYPFNSGRILECDYEAVEGEKSYYYRYGSAYINKGFVDYQLKTAVAKSLYDKEIERTFKAILNDPICKNLFSFYKRISLPSIDEIKHEAKRLVKNKHMTKKGKKLKFRGKHTKEDYKNPENIAFVEDDIKIFEYLTCNGFKIPKVGNYKSGGRVVDSLTLMPSWIRSLIKIDGTALTECDYSCLHPNIAIAIYGGQSRYLTHLQVADAAKLDVKSVKLEHLSFFNKEVWQMKLSPLFDYYNDSEPEMITNIINEKYNSLNKHKTTSQKMFKKEVEIMKEVVLQLNKLGIYVGYIYDALICHPLHATTVKKVMDLTALKHGVNTTAKISSNTLNRVVDSHDYLTVHPTISNNWVTHKTDSHYISPLYKPKVSLDHSSIFNRYTTIVQKQYSFKIKFIMQP